MAPLGKGFPIIEANKHVFLVGGGIGCAPLESVIDAYPDNVYYTFLGFDTKTSIYHETIFTEKSKQIE